MMIDPCNTNLRKVVLFARSACKSNTNLNTVAPPSNTYCFVGCYFIVFYAVTLVFLSFNQSGLWNVLKAVLSGDDRSLCFVACFRSLQLRQTYYNACYFVVDDRLYAHVLRQPCFSSDLFQVTHNGTSL